MSTAGLGFALSLFAAAAWSALDALRKRVGSDVSASAAVAALSLFQLPALLVLIAVGAAIAPESEPWSTIAPPPPRIDGGYWPLLAGSAALNLLANWLFLRAVQESPLSLTVPYLSLTPVFTSVSGYLALGELPTAAGAVGISVVTIGAVLLQAGGGRNPLVALREERGSLLMVGVALIWSVTPVLDKLAVEHANVTVHAAALASALFVAFWGGRAVLDRDVSAMLREFLAARGLLFAGGTVCVVAMVFQLAAYSFVDVAYVETIKRGIGVIAAVLLGWAAFAEGNIRLRLFAAGVMASGVALVLLFG